VLETRLCRTLAADISDILERHRTSLPDYASMSSPPESKLHLFFNGSYLDSDIQAPRFKCDRTAVRRANCCMVFETCGCVVTFSWSSDRAGFELDRGTESVARATCTSFHDVKIASLSCLCGFWYTLVRIRVSSASLPLSPGPSIARGSRLLGSSLRQFHGWWLSGGNVSTGLFQTAACTF
jgi:hypothetical protein